MTRGYFGVACYYPKTGINVGGLWRSAHIFDAAFLATIGRRYRRQPSDMTAASRHVPLLHFDSTDDFWEHIPCGCQSVAVEIADDARPLPGFVHPERAVYILGPEDGTLPEDIMQRTCATVRIPGRFCLNLAAAGAIVMYDRASKNGYSLGHHGPAVAGGFDSPCSHA
jgi:tRNA(Leu) C34 or U34 (ribose-2'-O)-methylase TrmL